MEGNCQRGNPTNTSGVESKMFEAIPKDVQAELMKDVEKVETEGTQDPDVKAKKRGIRTTQFSEILADSYRDMDDEFLNYLKSFNEKTNRQENQKLVLKKKFFYCALFVLILVVIFPYVMIFKFADRITDASIITLSITSLAEVISAIIILPQIIAEYLFNKEEENNKIKIITAMQSYNKDKRRLPDRDEENS